MKDLSGERLSWRLGTGLSLGRFTKKFAFACAN